MTIKGSIKSLQKSFKDSSHRSYDAIKGLYNIKSRAPINEVTSEALEKSIEDKNVDQVAALLEGGVDPYEEVENGKSVMSPMRVTKKPLNKIQGKDYQTAALMKAHEGKRGRIASNVIKLVVKGDLEDCAQIEGDELEIEVEKSLFCEMDSIWKSKSIKLLKVHENCEILGQVKIFDAKVEVNGKTLIHNGSAFGVEDFLDLKSNRLESDGFLGIGQVFKLLVEEDAVFGPNSYLESSYFKGFIGMTTDFLGKANFEQMDLLSNVECFLGSGAHIETSEGNIVTKTFMNSGQLCAENNLKISTERYIQTRNSYITASEKLELTIAFSNPEEWQGIMKSKKLIVFAIENVYCFGTVEASSAAITLFSLKKSAFLLDGFMLIEASPLFIEYYDKVSLERDADREQIGFIINGTLEAHAIYGHEVKI